MEKFKKYFEFSGTISGTNYFLRNLFSTIVAFFGGYSLGWGMASGEMGVMTLAMLVLVPVIWFNIATIYKRANALFTEDATLWTVGVLVLQVINQFFKGQPIGGLITLGLLIVGLIFIFKNSSIENHEG